MPCEGVVLNTVYVWGREKAQNTKKQKGRVKNCQFFCKYYIHDPKIINSSAVASQMESRMWKKFCPHSFLTLEHFDCSFSSSKIININIDHYFLHNSLNSVENILIIQHPTNSKSAELLLSNGQNSHVSILNKKILHCSVITEHFLISFYKLFLYNLFYLECNGCGQFSPKPSLQCKWVVR